MATTLDMMGRSVGIPALPLRIVSLVPSQTELLFDLGAGNQVVGVTKFCVHPPIARRQARVVGGTKQAHLDRIASLRPDLIIGNKEENERSMIEALAEHYPVWMSDIATLEDALQMIRALGHIIGSAEKADALASAISASFCVGFGQESPRPRVAYLIWQDPWMGAGGDTFIHAMIEKAGFENALETYSRYPELDPEQLLEAKPEHILLSSEPYPFGPRHAEVIGKLLPGCCVHLVNGEYFSWYGSRLLLTAGYFRTLRESIQLSGPTANRT